MGGSWLLVAADDEQRQQEKEDYAGDRGGCRVARCKMMDRECSLVVSRAVSSPKKSLGPWDKKKGKGLKLRSGSANALSDGFNQTVAVRCSCSALSQQRQRQQQKCVERGEESSRFRVKLSGPPLDRPRCLAASCRAVVAALQRQDGVVTNSRLPCSTAEKSRASLLAFAAVGPSVQRYRVVPNQRTSTQ